MIYGYIRVSTKDQHDDRQRLALLNFGVPSQNIFTDQQSGKDFNRPAYKRLLRKLKTDDTLVVKSIDRLGRNYAEIIEQWRIITMVDSMIDLFEGVKSKTKTSVDISAFIVSFTSTCASIQGAIFKLVDVKSPIVLPLVSAH